MVNNKLVIYHGGCYDGFTAAWVIRSFLEGWEDATFHPATYGETPPDPSGQDILIVDFSYPRETLERMAQHVDTFGGSIRVLDHHKTAQADLEGLPFCTFDMERSGAGLAWDELIGGGARPWLVDTVEDRDLWRFALEGTKARMAYIASQKQTFESWSHIYEAGHRAAENAGKAILEYIDTYNDKALGQAHKRVVGGFTVPVVNVPYSSASDCADILLSRYPDAPFAAAYFQRGDGLWQFSLRSADDREDVSAIAKQYGGGGHRNAAGFQIAGLPW